MFVKKFHMPKCVVPWFNSYQLGEQTDFYGLPFLEKNREMWIHNVDEKVFNVIDYDKNDVMHQIEAIRKLHKEEEDREVEDKENEDQEVEE